jgi:hypothetical protein
MLLKELFEASKNADKYPVIDSEHGTRLFDKDLVSVMKDENPDWNKLSELDQIICQLSWIAPPPRRGQSEKDGDVKLKARALKLQSQINEANGFDKFDPNSKNYHTQPNGKPTQYDALGNVKQRAPRETKAAKDTKATFDEVVNAVFGDAFVKRGGRFHSKDGSDLELYQGNLEGCVSMKHVPKAKRVAAKLGLGYNVKGIKKATY